MTTDLPPLPEPDAWTTLIEIDWARRNVGRAGSFYAEKAGPNDIGVYTAETVERLMRAYAAEAVRLARQQALAVADARRAHESSACAHHAGKWQSAYELHLTRHAAMADLMDAVWPDRPTKDHT